MGKLAIAFNKINTLLKGTVKGSATAIIAIDLDEELILSLIDQIPASDAHLSQGLRNLVDSFEIDKITDLIDKLELN